MSSHRQLRRRSLAAGRRLVDLIGPTSDAARQSLTALGFNSTSSFVAGLILASALGTFQRYPTLLTLVPAAIGLRGNVMGGMGNRLSTAIHTGTFSVSLRGGTVMGQNVSASLALSSVLSFALAVIASVVGRAFGLEGNINLGQLAMVSIVGGVVASVLVLIATVGLAVLGVRRNGVTLPDLDVVLNLPGMHNVLNALSAIAVAVELNVPDDALLRALAGFKGVGRRFQRYGDVPAKDGGVFTVIDDYGHHPVEMAATLAAARGAFPGRRLVLAFQPHRYTRTRDCFEDFVKVIGRADAVLLAEVYAAGEAPIAAADSRTLARALRLAGKVEPLFVDDIGALPQAIADTARAGDVVLCMGAGSIGSVPGKVVSMLLKKEH